MVKEEWLGCVFIITLMYAMIKEFMNCPNDGFILE